MNITYDKEYLYINLDKHPLKELSFIQLQLDEREETKQVGKWNLMTEWLYDNSEAYRKASLHDKEAAMMDMDEESSSYIAGLDLLVVYNNGKETKYSVLNPRFLSRRKLDKAIKTYEPIVDTINDLIINYEEAPAEEVTKTPSNTNISITQRELIVNNKRYPLNNVSFIYVEISSTFDGNDEGFEDYENDFDYFEPGDVIQDYGKECNKLLKKGLAHDYIFDYSVDIDFTIDFEDDKESESINVVDNEDYDNPHIKETIKELNKVLKKFDEQM